MRKFNNIKYSELTDEQREQLSDVENVNRDLSELVDNINTETKNIMLFKNHIMLTLITMVIAISVIGLIGLIGLVPLAFFSYIYQQSTDGIKWTVRSFKVSATVYNSLGYCSLVDSHTENINNSVTIGELYNLK